VRENSFAATSVHRRPLISSRVAAEFISPARKRWEKWESDASPVGATPVLTRKLPATPRVQQNQLRLYSLLKNSRSRCVLKGLGLSRAQ
jgi:hypothetical protein